MRKFLDLYIVREVMRILLVKAHACKGKESFHVKTKESTCANFVVAVSTEDDEQRGLVVCHNCSSVFYIL